MPFLSSRTRRSNPRNAALLRRGENEILENENLAMAGFFLGSKGFGAEGGRGDDGPLAAVECRHALVP